MFDYLTVLSFSSICDAHLRVWDNREMRAKQTSQRHKLMSFVSL